MAVEMETYIQKLRERKKIAFGSAFPNSIIAPSWMFYARTFPAGEIENLPIKTNTIRLSLGLEDAEDLVKDLTTALEGI